MTPASASLVLSLRLRYAESDSLSSKHTMALAASSSQVHVPAGRAAAERDTGYMYRSGHHVLIVGWLKQPEEDNDRPRR
jgi:hypothetical protein